MIKFRALKPSEISVRVDRITAKGVILLLYKNARVDMDILDESVGAESWKRSHEVIHDNLFCNVSIYDYEKKEWITKQDVGVESFSAKEKGEASDSFKRACVNWGIGKELYTAPFIFIPCKTAQKESGRGYDLADRYSLDGIYVSHVKYGESNEGRTINELVINDKKQNVIFSNMGKSKKPIDPEEPENPPNATDLINENQRVAIERKIKSAGYTVLYTCDKYEIRNLNEMNISQFVDCNNQLDRILEKKRKCGQNG